jgi:hypothetical protein
MITKFLQDFLLSFNKPVSYNNISWCFDILLRKRLPAYFYYYQNYSNLFESNYLPALCSITGFAINFFNERAN